VRPSTYPRFNPHNLLTPPPPSISPARARCDSPGQVRPRLRRGVGLHTGRRRFAVRYPRQSRGLTYMPSAAKNSSPLAQLVMLSCAHAATSGKIHARRGPSLTSRPTPRDWASLPRRHAKLARTPHECLGPKNLREGSPTPQQHCVTTTAGGGERNRRRRGLPQTVFWAWLPTPRRRQLVAANNAAATFAHAATRSPQPIYDFCRQ